MHTATAGAAPRTGGRILIDQLLAQGVRRITCVPGESYLAASMPCTAAASTCWCAAPRVAPR